MKALASAFTLLIILGAVKLWNLPNESLENTMSQSQIAGPSYIGETAGFHQFLISYKFRNTWVVPVNITGLESKILLNGTDYNSQQVTHNLATIQPGEEGEIPVVIQLSQAPIGSQERQTWKITVTSEISAESYLCSIKLQKSINRVDSIDWGFQNTSP